MRTQQTVAISAAVAWTAFVWVGRIRNALADDELGGATLAGVLALSATFLVLAAVAAWLLWRDRRRVPAQSGGRTALARAVLANTVLAAVVWTVRIADIAFAGDHEVGFVVVHAALGVVSVGLWLWAMRSIAETSSEEIQVRT